MSLDIFLTFTGVLLVVLAYQWLSYTKQSQQQVKKYNLLQQENKSLKAAASAQNQHLHALLSTISEVVLRVDNQGRVLGGNSQASVLFGLDKVSNFPQSLLLFYREKDWVDAFISAVKALPKQTVLPEMNLDGRVFLPRLVRADDDEIILLCTDITAYTLLQRKQKSLLENLMHDLKTPLTSLLGYARSIETFEDDKALRSEAAMVIAQEAKHINSLVNSMLTLNQIESQAGDTHHFCDATDILKQVWQGLDYAMQQKEVELELHVEKQILNVQMLDVDCHRIIMNVADNAVRFSPKKSKVYCHAQSDGKFICITIIDEGHGVSEKHIKRITERFYRVDNVRGRDNEGHGLGLAIVKETLEREGGLLQIDNVDAGGLVVRLNIPKV